MLKDILLLEKLIQNGSTLAIAKKGIVERFHLRENRLEIKRKASDRDIQMLSNFIK